MNKCPLCGKTTLSDRCPECGYRFTSTTCQTKNYTENNEPQNEVITAINNPEEIKAEPNKKTVKISNRAGILIVLLFFLPFILPFIITIIGVVVFLIIFLVGTFSGELQFEEVEVSKQNIQNINTTNQYDSIVKFQEKI